MLLHVAGIYENRAVSYIELSMQQISKPSFRAIPKPRMRRKSPESLDDKNVPVKEFIIPKFIVDTVEDNKEHNYERINLPQLPDNIDVAGCSVQGLMIKNQGPEFNTARDYFEMLYLRINSLKKYPESAKSRGIEGRVKIQFELSKDGTLSDIKIIKSSHHKDLDEAALEAIKKASPFPSPPAYIIKTPVRLNVEILFELN